MNQSTENGKQAPKDHDDHHDEGNPMPDTHHVNPKSDGKQPDAKQTDDDKARDDKSRQKTGSGKK
ncbi:hypothetical protein [Vreelandella nigrificans]|uniref:Uncharacterized protein n=1 Tax=Vreelandella nigrificans TaxID=2042704 RepID=A0A2A4HMW0_9GAMM|nr:hypothetical protein [Halomonas nigrificans]PCF95394.1 hypothetical protein CPA45_12740 [Halomonas nigrificans]